jgi:hypothetical protein
MSRANINAVIRESSATSDQVAGPLIEVVARRELAI